MSTKSKTTKTANKSTKHGKSVKRKGDGPDWSRNPNTAMRQSGYVLIQTWGSKQLKAAIDQHAKTTGKFKSDLLREVIGKAAEGWSGAEAGSLQALNPKSAGRKSGKTAGKKVAAKSAAESSAPSAPSAKPATKSGSTTTKKSKKMIAKVVKKAAKKGNGKSAATATAGKTAKTPSTRPIEDLQAVGQGVEVSAGSGGAESVDS